MQIQKEQLKTLVHGALYIFEEDGWFRFCRFTDRQLEELSLRSRRHQGDSGSGMFLEVTGDITKIRFDYILKTTNGNCPGYSIDVMEDGVQTFSKNGGDDAEIHGTLEYEPKGGKRITVRFPWSKQLRMRNLEIEGDFRPSDRKVKTLILGDSITHGTRSFRAALPYAAQLSDGLLLDSVSQAIGGDCFDANFLEPDIPFTPDLIILAYGTNDWAKLENPVENSGGYFKRLREIYPTTPVIYFLPIYWEKGLNAEKRKCGITLDEARKGYKEQAEQYGIKVINARNFIPNDQAFFDDGLHPNDLGFAVMGPKYIEAVRNALPELFGGE